MKMKGVQMKNNCFLAVIIITAAVLFGLSVPAYPGEIIGLNSAISLALENNNRYKIAREKVNESRLKVREAWGRLWPELSSDANISWWGADKGIMTASNGQYDLKFVKASITINPGVFYNSLRASQDGHIIAVNDEQRIKLDNTLMTIKLYYRILLTAEIIKVRVESIKALEENLRVITAGYKIGTYTKLDYLHSKVAAANEKTRLINARNDYQSAKASLNIHMGREMDSPLDLDERAIAVKEGEENDIIKWTEAEKKEKIAAMTAGALKSRPEIMEIKSKKAALVHGSRAGESIYVWPTLYASANYGMNREITKESGFTSTGDIHADYALYNIGKVLEPTGWNKNWSVTVGATYRWGGLLPFDPAHARADQLMSQAKQTDFEMDEFVRNVRLDIQQGLLKLVSASNAIMSQKDNIESAEESLRVAIVQLKNGMIDNTKFLESNVEFSNAKMLYIQALYELQSSRAELNRSMGNDYFSFYQN
jgi:outer membrane protein